MVLAGSVTDPDDVMTPLRTAAAHSRIAQGTRAGRSGESSPLCANAHGFTACIQGCASPGGNAEGRMRWAQLSKRVFDINIERCPQCRAQMKLIAVIEEPAAIARILTHLGLAAQPPPRAPAVRAYLCHAA